MTHRSLAARIETEWENAKSSLWFLPAILVTVATIMAFGLLIVDRQYDDAIKAATGWLFGGDAGAARDLLATIAGSVITVISIAFSLTVIALQQASAQFTPRVLRAFTSDKGNQLVLGTYLATFIYSLLVLQSVRDSDENGAAGFVPSLAVTTAVLLAFICIGFLIYYISHIATSLQAGTIIKRVHGDLLEQIETLYPEQIGNQVPIHKPQETLRAKKNEITTDIYAPAGGFVSRIEEDIIRRSDLQRVRLININPKIGDFVLHGELLVTVFGSEKLRKTEQEQIASAIIIDQRRTTNQDPLFPVRQLVDIALKGLSPGINDQTTAQYCIQYLGDALSLLADRDFPNPLRTFPDSSLKLHSNQPTWDDFVSASFDEIQIEAKNQPHVTEVLLSVLQRLAMQITLDDRKPAIHALLLRARDILHHENMTTIEKQRIMKLIMDTEASLMSR